MPTARLITPIMFAVAVLLGVLPNLNPLQANHPLLPLLANFPLPPLLPLLSFAAAAAAATPTCSQTVATSGEAASVCAPPWVRSPTTTPTVGTAVTVSISLPPSTSGLSPLAAAVNGMDVSPSFSNAGGGLFTATFVTPAGGTGWPWDGLDVRAALVDDDSAAFTNVSATTIPGSTWSEEAGSRGVLPPAADTGRGVCMGDVDDDGDVDMFAVMTDGMRSQLWLNDGGGNFVDVAVAWNVAGDASDLARGCGFGDADGDGLLDLFVTRYTDSVNELYMNTGGGFVEEGLGRGVRTGADDTMALTWGDVDGDGDIDVFVCSTGTKVNRLYVNDGLGVFVEDGGDRGVGSIALSSRQSAMADIDDDGDLDILVVNAGNNELYVNGGEGDFMEASVGRGFSFAGNGRGLAVGDWSGDGMVDVYVLNFGGRDLLLLNDGSGEFSEVGADRGAGGSTGDSFGAAMVDTEGDGDLDIVVGVDGADLVWVNDGHGFRDGSGDLLLGSSATSFGLSVGDIDGDGDVDVIMVASGDVYVNHNAQPGTASRVVIVRPLTAAGAQSAFGAVVRVECVGGCLEDWVGVRSIDGGSSYHSQNGYDAVVGVPTPSATYNVSVRWAGDVHNPSNWTTHPRLGGVVPSTLPSAQRLFVVRPLGLTASLGRVLWDYPGVAARLGLGAAPPSPGDPVSIPITLSPASNTHDISVISATVNGLDVSPSWSLGANGSASVEFAGGGGWPWADLDVVVTLEDGGGLAVELAAGFVPGSTWSEESDARGMPLLANGHGRGVCMGDVDGDGDVDVFVAMNIGTENQLWRNNGGGVFVNEAALWSVAGDASDRSHGCGFGDADGDGLLDLFVTRLSDAVNNLYMNTGSGFAEDGVARGVSSDSEDALGLSWGDVDGDGDVDVFVCSANRVNRLYLNGGGGVFAEVGGVGSIARNSRQPALVDIDGDGDLDVLVVNAGANELYVNGGTGVFAEAGVDRGFSDSGSGLGIGVGDWSGDGVVDVYVSNSDSRDLLCLNDGDGFFVEVGVARGVGASVGSSRGVSMFDMEGDGDVDIVVGGFVGVDLVWENDGAEGFGDGSGDLLLGSSASTFGGPSVGDIDSDGDVDVIMQECGDVYVNHNSQPGASRVVVVRPLTAAGAQSAFGATVRVVCVEGCAKGWAGMRVIDGGSSLYSQNGYDAVVGVPTPSATYNVSVRWAGGVHTPSNWTTHWKLGGIVPATAASRLVVVRPGAAGVSISSPPWDVTGLGEPSVGDTHPIFVSVMPGVNVWDVGPVVAVVNGQDVAPSWSWVGNGTFEVAYVTESGGELWPWSGLNVSIVLLDSGGLTSSAASSIVVGSPWSEESAPRGLTAFANGNGRGVCMGDVEGDGDVDVFVAMSTSPTLDQLWVNDGSGLFRDEAVLRGVAPDGTLSSRGCAFGDLTGSGTVDLLVTHFSDNVLSMFVNHGGAFTEEAASRGIGVGDNSLSIALGDVDGDSDVDAFVCSGNSIANKLYVNGGGGTFAEDGFSRGVGVATLSTSEAVMVDVDGDGALDILIVNIGASDELYINTGAGVFGEDGVGRGFSDGGPSVGLAAGDWSGDGVVDVFVAGHGGRSLLFLNDGLGVFTEVGASAGVEPHLYAARAVSMLDVEGDGDVDILLAVEGGQAVVWLGGGGDLSEAPTLLRGAGAASYCMAVGDVDGDGDVDAIMGASGDALINTNARGGVRRVVTVRPLTAAGAQSAFGAAVTLSCVMGCTAPWTALRSPDGGSGFWSQNGYDAVFGVPVPDAAYNVSVRWVGDAHPPSNWTSHWKLGGIVPSTLASHSDRLFVVRPAPPTLVTGAVEAWDFPALTRGGASGPPASGDTVIIPIHTQLTALDLTAVSATVNAQDVRSGFSLESPGVYTLQYTTVPGQETWPWVGLLVDLVVVDSGGIVASLNAVTDVPGTTLAPALAPSGLAAVPLASSGVCSADMDGDGDDDLVIAVLNGDNLFFENVGGAFQESQPRFPGSDTNTVGCAVADLDGDRDLDVFFAVDGGSSLLFMQTSSLVFEEEHVGRGVSVAGASRSAAWGDVDGDGDVDLFVCVHGGVNALFANDGDGRFTDVTVTSGLSTIALCEQAIMVDVDVDSDLDVVVANNVNADELFLNDGVGVFQERAASRGLLHGSDSRGLAAGDLDGDGSFDIVIAQASEPVLVYVNDGGGTFVESGVSGGVNGTSRSSSVALFDVEHDGDLDMVVGRPDGLAAAVWVNDGQGGFVERGVELGVASTSSRVTVVDIDGDGDMELVFSNPVDVFESYAADGGVVNWLKVRPLTRDFARSAFGAVVRVECAEGCAEAWSGIRVIDGGSGLWSQSGYVAHFGLPVTGTAFDVEVVFVGCARHGKGTDAGLGGVAPGSFVEVVDRPYLVDVVGVYSNSASVLGVNDTVVVVVTAGQHRTDLEPGDGCCFVNSVQVVDTFVGDGEGRYNLTYVVAEGDAEWGVGDLVVLPTLQSVGRNLSMVEVEYLLGGSPAGDPVSPVIEFECRPGVASANVFEPICVSCPGESLSCNFSYVVESTTLNRTYGFVPDANYTSPTSASFFVGPFNDSDIATLMVFAADGGGNMNATEGLTWRVDTSSPVTTLVTKPDPVTSRDGANFALQCSELKCSFEYRFNGGPLTLLGGNGTVGDVAVVDTVMIGGPERVSPVTANNVSFSMNVSEPSMWVNATVGVEIGGFSWELPVVDNVTEVLQLPILNDGEHVLVAAGKGGDGTSDVTPIKYVFTVDTTPPSVSILRTPADGERGNPTVVVDADEDDCVFEWRAGPSPLNSSWALTSSAVIVPEVASSVPHTFEVRAVDPAGNVGSVVSTSWTPAACPDSIPDVVVTSDVGVSVGRRYVTFDVVGGVEWSDFEHALDGGDWVPSSAHDIVLDVGLGGDHELHVRAAAPAVCNSVLAGIRPPPQAVEWTEPAPLPLQVTMLTKPDPSTPDVFAEFELLGSRRLAWFEYSLDGEVWTPTEALLSVGPLQAGSHTMRVRAVDSDGVNRGDVQSHSWAITAASDSSVVLTNLPDGEHSLLVIATDEAGSVEVAPNTFVWRVDTTPPTTTANRTSPRFSSSPTAVIDVSCEGEIDDCKFCWTSDTVAGNCSSTSPLFVTAPKDGYHVVDVRAVDSAGLESAEGVDIEWTVDSTPPVVTLIDIDGVLMSPRYDTGNVDAVLGNTSLRLNLTANEDVLGFDVVLNGAVLGSGRFAGPILELGDLPTIINNLVVGSTDLAGNVGEGVTLRVLVDVRPPNSLFAVPPPSLTNSFSVRVGIAGEDDATGSGVDGVEVSLVGEGGAIVDAVMVDGTSGTVVFGNLTTGVYNVTAVSMDVAGNVDGSAVVATMVVDHVAPVSEFAEAVPSLVASSSLTVWAASSEEGDMFARVMGVTGWQLANAIGAVVFTGLPDGTHTVELRGVDAAGNEELQPYVSAVVEVDTTPPMSSSTAFGEGLVDVVGVSGVDVATRATTISVNASANEAVAGFWVAVDGVRRSELVMSPTMELFDLVEGVRNLSIAAVDLAGNVDPSPSHHIVLVDLTPPASSRVVSVPPSPTLLSNISVEVAAEDVDGGVGMAHVVVSVVRVDDGVGWEDMVVEGGSGRVWVSDLTSGVYNVSVVGVDGVGNADSSSGWELVTVDQVPPVTEFAAILPSFTSSPDVVVWVGANEPATTSGRVLGVTDWLPVNGSGAVVFASLPDGNHTVELRSVDVAGNEELEPFLSAGVVVDTMPPVLFWTADVEPFTSSSAVSACFTANDSNHVSFSASPGGVVLRGDDCFEAVVGEAGGFIVNITGTDAAGNVGEVLTTSWVLDRAPPSSVIVSSITNSSSACVHGDVMVCDAPTSATLVVACDDGSPSVVVSPCRPQFAITLVEATVAAGCAAPTSSRRRLSTDGFVDAPTTPFTLDTTDGDGLYAVAVRSVDGAGNVEVGNTTMMWFVDTAAPASAPTLVQTPDKVVSSTTALFVIQLSDDSSPGQTAFLYKLDDGPERTAPNLPSPNSASVQLVLTGLADGDHKVEVWARDQAGNDGPFVLYDWAVATEAPGVSILSTPAAISADVTPSFVFQAVWSNGTASGSGVEPLAGIEVSLGEGFSRVCEDTVSSGGVCVWNASLADRGEGTYTVNVRAVLGGNTGDPTPHTWSYALCDDDEYAVIDSNGGIVCFACPPGGDCSGRRTSQADIAAVQGFWAPPGSTGLRFYECPVEEACLPGGDVTVGNSTLHVVSHCNEGYTGTLCAVCEDGFFEQFGLCVSCGAQSGVAWVIMFAVLVAVIGVGVLFFKFRDLMPIDQLKVTLSMVQIIASANTAYAIPWPPLFADFLNTMRVFLIEAVSLTRANCAQPMTFYGSLTVTLVAFKVVLLVVVFGPVLLHKWKQRSHQHTLPPAQPGSQGEGAHRTRRRSSLIQSMATAVHAAQRVDWAKIFKITFLFLFVAYPGVSLKIMKTFKCEEVEGEFWLVADMRLKCYEGDWYGYALYAFVMACLYTGGLPLAITLILWRNRRKLGEDGVVAKWGFLYETYGVGAYLWEVEELVRKLWLSALVVLMAEGSPLQVTVAVLISGWAHVLHAVYKPWRGVGEGGSSVYALQHGSLFVTCFVFIMGLLFKVEGVSQDGTTYNFLAWAMLLACVGFLVAAAFVLVTAVATQLRKSRAKASVTGGNSSVRRSTRDTVGAWSGGAKDDSSLGSRPGAVPRAVRASRMGGAQAGQMAWVGNPLKAVKGDACDNGTPAE